VVITKVLTLGARFDFLQHEGRDAMKGRVHGLRKGAKFMAKRLLTEEVGGADNHSLQDANHIVTQQKRVLLEGHNFAL
jgi:hypothetical protein